MNVQELSPFKTMNRASLLAQMVKNLPSVRRTGFNSWVGTMPWRKNWQPTPAFFLGEFHGQRNLEGLVKIMDTLETKPITAHSHGIDYL